MRGGSRAYAVAIAALALVLLVAPAARAGSYEVIACDASVAGGVASSWQAAAQPGFPVSQRCPRSSSGASGLLSESPPSAASKNFQDGAWIFEAPLGTRLGSITFDSAIYRAPSAAMWTAAIGAWLENPLFPSLRVDGCWANEACSIPDGWRRVGPVDLQGRPGLRMTVACGAGDCAPAPGGARMAIANVRVTLLDDSRPSLSVGGPLWLDGPQLRTRPVTVAASDNSGIRTVSLLVDGSEQAVLRSDCQPVQKVPCPNVPGGSLSLAASTVPDGVHTVTVRATDSAGNSTDASRSIQLLSPPATRLTVRAAGRRGRAAHRVRVSFRRSVLARGRLILASGPALAGQQVAVYSTQLASGARRQQIATVPTDAEGRFSFRIPPGPARLVRFAFEGSDAGGRSAAALILHVPASTAIAVRPARIRVGQEVLVSGRLRLAGARVPRAGKLVILQARERGRWHTVATTRSRADGRWRRHLRFEARPGTYPLRAVVRREASFPFYSGASRAVRVSVQP